MNVLISACLMGIACRYDGGTQRLDCLDELLKRHVLIPVCPEVLGGLPTPRDPSEIRDGRVVSKAGADVTEAFEMGAGEAARIARMCGCTCALLKERSPSCGCGTVYDGTFSGALTHGNGLCAQKLLAQGVRVLGESRARELLGQWQVRRADSSMLDVLTEMALRLWADNRHDELRDELASILNRREAAFFLLCVGDKPVGFAQCQLRHDYVEGTEHSPVGYLEGVYVDAVYRHMGGARRLMSACEDWVRDMGCDEFASDCELDNKASLAFHLACGFSEANRTICFVKRL